MAPVELIERGPFRRVIGRCRHAIVPLPVAAILLLNAVDAATAQVVGQQTFGVTRTGDEAPSNRAVNDAGSTDAGSPAPGADGRTPAGQAATGAAVGEGGSSQAKPGQAKPGQATSLKAFGDLERVFPQAAPSPHRPSTDWTAVDTAITETAQPSGAWSTFARAPSNIVPAPSPAFTPPEDRGAPRRAASLPPADEGPRERRLLDVPKGAGPATSGGHEPRRPRARATLAARKVGSRPAAPRWIPLPSVLEPTNKP